ncbi:uncharacterized protein [Elaeis guineensis]|uniref:uncharacterized protein n=1 Tax=Elaeis guineensis var. tenera TaxID=51953 RepID=UPI003C6D7F51
MGKRGSLIAIMALSLAFKEASGLKINFHKSPVISIHDKEVDASDFALPMNCKRKNLPFTYFRLLLHNKKLPKLCWLTLIEKFSKRLASWKDKLLSVGGQTGSINAVLSALPSHYMSIFILLKWVLNKLDQMRKAFLWMEKESIGGFYCLFSWDA